MSGVEAAGPDDIEQLVELQCALFREDGTVHDRFVDLRWALNESLPDHRRLGLAGQLTEAFVSWARERGCVQVGVDCYVDNEPARRLYERHGFVAQSLRSVRTL